jgi:hypothetical protein
MLARGKPQPSGRGEKKMTINKPSIGDYVVPDGWNQVGSWLERGEEYVDASFAGCQFRLPCVSCAPIEAAVNIIVTGDVPNRHGMYRIKIQFVNDGESDITTGGWIRFLDDDQKAQLRLAGHLRSK